jgi:hypothetical protein
MRDASNLVWLTMPNDLTYWYSMCRGLRYGDETYSLDK